MNAIDNLKDKLKLPGRHIVSGVPSGVDALTLAEIMTAAGHIHVCPDDQQVFILREQLAFFAPKLEVLEYPSWDCLPYDRVSPSTFVVAKRLQTLAALKDKPSRPVLVLTTVAALTQRTISRNVIEATTLRLAAGQRFSGDTLTNFFAQNGFSRTGTVMEPGDFAVRGGLIDVFPPGQEQPVRLDFFGDALESIRSFDPQTQRTTEQLKSLVMLPANEIQLSAATAARFRSGYAKAFGGIDINDPLYESVTNSRTYQGMEHWLPLFHEELGTLPDYLPDAPVSFAHTSEEAMTARLTQVGEYYDARKEALEKGTFGAAPYKPLPISALYLDGAEISEILSNRSFLLFSPFERPEQHAMSVGGKQGRSFAAERADAGSNVYDHVRAHVDTLRTANKRVVIACWSEGSQDRMATILGDHGVSPVVVDKDWAETQARPRHAASVVVVPLESGFETADVALISEQDILGDRLVRRARKARKANDVFAELSSINIGDLMVHVDHGIGRFEGLRTLEVQGSPHDCLLLVYAGNDRLFIPVENIDLLSRYGSETEGVQLDKLGGGAWQAKKARLKERIREIANDLIKTAAARELKTGEVMAPPEGAFDEFCARFPYEETEDQLSAIEAVMEDLQAGRPMDRLVCGDVGFGKTEVALRAAFVAAYSGKQVAVVVPTTLLCRQHFKTFSGRFKGLPLRLAQASRLVGRKDIEETKKGLLDGTVDIVVGTHALLADSVKFRDLGLLIIDEEQHFGVKHKERLKSMKANVHVLTLTATPIPRTLQLAMSGIRDMSLIITPPLDRLAVRTYVSPFDPVIIREHLLREHFRGGQSFFVVPRISDLEEMAAFLRESVPEVRFRSAHGRMSPTELEDIMGGFYDRSFEVLLSTTIVESGLDIPTANTLIIHRADIFGLAQLYQLRGRVGRSKQRAYALLTTPPRKQLTATAERRLQVLQSLDSLGAGFTLASHDLDIRGGGNLLGEEQSGNIREVGFELYQQMLEEAVASMRANDDTVRDDGAWSPQINIGTSVLIPEGYVSDLQVRLGLYRRLADFTEQADLDAFGAELHDRFGRLPEEVEHLLDIVSIKILCRGANVQSVDAGAKGATVVFRNGTFPKPQNLVKWIADQGSQAKLRPDMKLVLIRDWDTAKLRLKGTRTLMQTLLKLAV
jgi:transcription-repair coupling factor (superfamily II helicase)